MLAAQASGKRTEREECYARAMSRFYEKGYIQKRWIELCCKGDWKRFMERMGEPHPDWMLEVASIKVL